MKIRNTKMASKEMQNGLIQTDELYQTNSIAYIEADLKINHLRILMAIIKHLQSPIRYKVEHSINCGPIPDALLPEFSSDTRFVTCRSLEIPVSDFHFGRNNGARVRTCLDELCSTRIVFPSASVYLLNVFPGVIAGYSFPAYSQTVQIFLSDHLISRLLLTEQGYGHYSHSKALTLKNKYTVRLYWLICSWRNRGGFVISLDTFRKILQLGRGYEKFSNIVSRVLAPAQEQLQACFPIWFQYRLYDLEGRRRIVFKIKVILPREEQKRLRNDAYDFCFNVLAKTGISPVAIDDLFSRVETEDLKPFLTKLSDLSTYISSHRDIRDPRRYLHASLESWLDNWLLRYQDIGE